MVHGLQTANRLRQIVIALHVYQAGEYRDIPPIDWGDGTVTRRGLCFDKDALDPETGHKIGKVTECFAEVEEHNGGFVVRNISFIHLEQGSIVALNRSTLQPMLDPDSPATHTIGACPPNDELNVIAATGQFRGFTGRSRIVGTVNLDYFRTQGESAIKFVDWIYLIQLSLPAR